MKTKYIAPQIKTVKFNVELGYGASVNYSTGLDRAIIDFRDENNNSTNRNGQYGNYSANADGSYNFFGE